MKLSRRGLFGLVIGSALAALVGGSQPENATLTKISAEGQVAFGTQVLRITDVTNYTYSSTSTVFWPPIVLGSVEGGQNFQLRSAG